MPFLAHVGDIETDEDEDEEEEHLGNKLLLHRSSKINANPSTTSTIKSSTSTFII